MTQLQLALLGPFALYEEGEPVDLNIGKLQALLAYLAVTAKTASREQVLALLWAESHPDAARKNLRNRLWQLRQLTEAELIVAEGDTLALAPGVQSDVGAFTAGIPQYSAISTTDPAALQSLLDQWRGPLLDGIQLHEAPDFELWLGQQRERFGQLYLQGLDTLIRYRATQEDWTAVIALAQQGLEFDALHEPFYKELMIGYAQLGQRTEALRQYTQLQERLAAELDLAPLPEIRALRRRIADGLPLGEAMSQAQGQPSLESTASQFGETLIAPEESHSTATPLTAPPQQYEQHPSHPPHPFVGRQAQLNALTAAYQESYRGRSCVVLIGGELGMGKTTLWQQWISQVPNSAVVLTTRCLNTTQSLPFEPMRRLLGTLRCREQWSQMANMLLPVWQAELVRLAPSLQAVAPALTHTDVTTTATQLSPSEERGLIAEALTQFLRAFAGKPLILFIDDLHWVDGATLDWLLYLTDRMANEPLLLVGAYRPEEKSPQITKVVAQWQRDGLLQRLDLPHLTEEEATVLLTALGTNEKVIHYLHKQSGGNPYYLTQLSDVAVDGIPASLVDLVQARLSYVDARWQPVLQAAAILEPAIDLNLLTLTSGGSEEETLDAIDGLLAASILVEQGDEYEFAHPLVATVMRDGLSSGRRKLYHRRAAEGLLKRYQGQETEIAGQLAHHYAVAGLSNRAASYASMAGAQALRIGAANEAVAFYRQAQALEPTAERQLELGQALLLQPGQLEAARRQMEEALVAYETAGDCQGTTKAGLRLAASYLGTQEVAQVLHWARRVLPDLESVEDPILHAGAQYLMGTAKFRNGYAFSEAEAHYRAAMNLVAAEGLDPEIALMSCFEWGNLCLEQGDYAAAVTKFQQAQQLAQQRQSLFFEILALNNLAYALLSEEQYTAAQSTIAQAFALADTYGLLSIRYYLLSTQGELALATGELEDADTAFQQAIELAEKYDNKTFVANLWAHRGRVAQARGNLAEAQTWLKRARNAVAEEGAPYLQSQIDLWLATVAVEQQDHTTAATYLHSIQERAAATEYERLQQIARQLRDQLTELQC